MSEKNYKKIVIKIGSSLFYAKKEQLDLHPLKEIARQVSYLIQCEGKEIIIVSSGAIALGMNIMNLKSRPRDLAHLQAVAAIGQNALIDNYASFFQDYKLNCAQVLLTWEDFNDRKRYLNAKNTLLTLLKLRSVPVINENDTISTDEIRFGDNDRLSALVATLINAELLVILSDVDGLWDKNKRVIKVVSEINSTVRELACPTNKKTCVGGMASKIEAAKISVDSGISCVIANGRRKDIILSTLKAPTESGTLFIPKKGHLAARERWIAFGAQPKGKISVDDGAKNALINKKSLLSVGVIATSGIFESGDIVSVRDKQNYEFARGKVGISSKQLEKVKGSRFDKEIIHRDNIVIL